MSNHVGRTISDESRMTLLAHLLLSPQEAVDSQFSPVAALRNLSPEGFREMLALASSNHVIVRAMEIALASLRRAGDELRAEWAAAALESERGRIAEAIGFLGEIFGAFEGEGLDVTVIKSLDHWPDLGSDIDLYTNAPSESVCALMQRRFKARIEARSWGDRLACKWNFMIPGLAEPVEIHIGRLGQTGEQVEFATKLPERARTVQVGGGTFRVPCASDRLMISTLQRMYRHFYFRLCDMVDSARLVDSGQVDYRDLRNVAQAAGIWEGVATYLVIVSDYVQQYRGADLDVPNFLVRAAQFGGEQVSFGRDFLRVPILPQSAALYRTQLAGMLRRLELQSSARLGLLPWLATAAAVGMKLTGSDKGIW